MSIFAAFILALLLALLFAPGYRKGSYAPLVIFFSILFLAAIASQYWIVPFGPSWYGVSWLPLLFIVLVFTFMMATPSPYDRKPAKQETTADAAGTVTGAAVSIFIWVLVLMLLVAIFTGINKVPVLLKEPITNESIHQ